MFNVRLRSIVVLIVFTSLFAVVNGCSQPLVFIRVTLKCPGRSAVEMDEIVASRTIRAVSSIPSVTKIRALSYSARTDLYLVIEQRHLPQIKDEVARVIPTYPADVQFKGFQELDAGESVPDPETGFDNELSVKIKEEANLESLDITTREVAARIHEILAAGEMKDKSIEEILEMRFTLKGQDFSLKQIAEIKVIEQPKCVARNW